MANPYYEPYQNELEHYGVLGMKWGVRKDANAAYSKASNKLRKLDTKVVKRRDKQRKLENSASSKRARANKLLDKASTTRGLKKAQKASRKATKAETKATRMTKKADRSLNKAIKWSNKMEKVFSDIELTNVSEEDTALGQSYIELKFQKRRT